MFNKDGWEKIKTILHIQVKINLGSIVLIRFDFWKKKSILLALNYFTG